jgi:hypothetical protein
MTKPNIQIGDLVREMTDEEYEEYLETQAYHAAYEAEAKATEDARVSALAKLASLGLTPEELEALIG